MKAFENKLIIFEDPKVNLLFSEKNVSAPNVIKSHVSVSKFIAFKPTYNLYKSFFL